MHTKTKRGDANRFRIAAFATARRRQGSASKIYGFRVLDELLIARLKVVPLSKRRLPPVRLSVDPPSADALLDCAI